jgi:hypothetical protein
MLARALVGAVAAAVILFILGFVFFATPLHHIAVKSLPDPQAASVQAVLAQNMPETGAYAVPSARTADQTTLYGRGPVATVHYNVRGYPVGDGATMVKGLLHMLAVGLLMAAGLYHLSRSIGSSGERLRLLLLGVVGATLFIHLRDPIWFHHSWGYALYLFFADTVSLALAGFAILKLLPATLHREGPAEAPTSV